jgi:hypothetical protein
MNGNIRHVHLHHHSNGITVTGKYRKTKSSYSLKNYFLMKK